MILGVYPALRITGFGQGDLVEQVHGSILPLWGVANTGDLINNWLLVIGLLTTLTFFFFSKEHKGALGGTAKVGIYFLMVSFGASYGYTVMARISLLIGRVMFLLRDWLGIMQF
jgi:LPXTG-motif cell wall-anchored protein